MRVVASKVGNLQFKFGQLRLRVLELFAIYAADGQTDRRMDESNAYCVHLPYGREHNNYATLFEMVTLPATRTRSSQLVSTHHCADAVYLQID